MTSRSWVLTHFVGHLMQEMPAHIGDVLVMPSELGCGILAVV